MLQKLPGLDCGSCGSPNCKSLAEDIVQGEAIKTDCIFKLRERIRDLAQQMVGLAAKLPPSLDEKKHNEQGWLISSNACRRNNMQKLPHTKKGLLQR